MKEDYPLALVLIQAVSRMGCAVRRVLGAMMGFRARGGGITGRFNWEVEAATDAAYPNSG